MPYDPKRLGGASRRAPRSGAAMSATVAIVPGGGGPLAHATVLTLAARGPTVVAVDRQRRLWPGQPTLPELADLLNDDKPLDGTTLNSWEDIGSW
jgi:NAD(P)-dependent dehydrogenase (short-subunit alcohol dehydrogenase family)